MKNIIQIGKNSICIKIIRLKTFLEKKNIQ